MFRKLQKLHVGLRVRHHKKGVAGEVLAIEHGSVLVRWMPRRGRIKRTWHPPSELMWD